MAMKPVGVFGGSFDPPHAGHVALVEQALAVLGLPEIWVIPAGYPVHRSLSGRADADMRLNWLRRIFSGRGDVLVRDWEVPGTTPTIVTLHRIRRDFPGRRVILLLGADAFAGIHTWVDFPEHRNLCDVAVFDRAGCPPPARQGWRLARPRQWRELADQDGCGNLLCIRTRLPDVSATLVRRLAASGKPLAGLVPECVREEIEKAYGRRGSECGNRD